MNKFVVTQLRMTLERISKNLPLQFEATFLVAMIMAHLTVSGEHC